MTENRINEKTVTDEYVNAMMMAYSNWDMHKEWESVAKGIADNAQRNGFVLDTNELNEIAFINTDI